MEQNSLAIDLNPLNTPFAPKESYPSDKLNLLMLLGLYLIWGMMFGYYEYSLNVLLIERGATYFSLSIVTMIGYPFTLKFLFAPFVDNYYINFLGKHKTYVLISNYLMSGILFLNAFYMDEWIQNLEITKITLVGFFIIFCLSVQSIAVDAWPPSLLRPENLRYVGFIANFGYLVGTIFAYNLFIWFNSKSFCNKYIYSTEHDSGLLSNFGMLCGLSAINFLVTAMIHAFKREQATPKKEFANLKDFLRTCSKFFTNPNLRFFLFATLLMGFGMQPIETGYVIILKKGFSQNILSLIDLTSSIFAAFGGIYGSHLATKKKEYTYILVCFAFNIVGDMFYFFFVIYYEDIDENLALVFYMLEDVTLVVNQSIRYVLFISFMLRIADPKMAAISTTFFYSMSDFNDLWGSSLSLFLIDYVDYTILCLVGIGMAILFFLCFGKKIRRMESIEKSLWLIAE